MCAVGFRNTGVTQIELKYDLCYAYKGIFGLVDVDSCCFKPLKDSRIRGHNLRVTPYRFSTNIRQHFFTVTVAYIWNSLSQDVSFGDFSSFKRPFNNVNFNKLTSFWSSLCIVLCLIIAFVKCFNRSQLS